MSCNNVNTETLWAPCDRMSKQVLIDRNISYSGQRCHVLKA